MKIGVEVPLLDISVELVTSPDILYILDQNIGKIPTGEIAYIKNNFSLDMEKNPSQTISSVTTAMKSELLDQLRTLPDNLNTSD